jgi:hypothetical protein
MVGHVLPFKLAMKETKEKNGEMPSGYLHDIGLQQVLHP